MFFYFFISSTLTCFWFSLILSGNTEVTSCCTIIKCYVKGNKFAWKVISLYSEICDNFDNYVFVRTKKTQLCWYVRLLEQIFLNIKTSRIIKYSQQRHLIIFITTWVGSTQVIMLWLISNMDSDLISDTSCPKWHIFCHEWQVNIRFRTNFGITQ